MKQLVAIVRPNKMEEIKNYLAEIGVKGITISQVMGAGEQKELTQVYRGNVYQINLFPKIKIEVVLGDDLVEQAIDIIMTYGKTGELGDGKIFVMPVERAIRIRTGEEGEQIV